MTASIRTLLLFIVAALLAAGTGASSPDAQPPRPIDMEELHRMGGVPRGWKFTLPRGEAGRGRRVFDDLACHSCHLVAGEDFPAKGVDRNTAGPALTGMGPLHPPEYFAESVLSPNAVIIKGPGYTGPDGRSIMPSYADSLSVTELIDLVAYIRSLTTGAPRRGGGPGREESH